MNKHLTAGVIVLTVLLPVATPLALIPTESVYGAVRGSTPDRKIRRVTLDELDIKILNSLSRNRRASYDKMSPEIGLSLKSIKTRVKKMQSDGIIHNFVVEMNLKVLGYSRFCLLTVTNKKPQDDRDIVHRLSLVGLSAD
jgi:predicted transcriptional regulator